MRISQEIFPRVVALIVSISKEKKPNVMTVSFLMPISFEPKYLAFSLSPKRYTFELLKKNPQFTFNICEKNLLEVAKICGSYSGREKNKFELVNITPEKSTFIEAPSIKECPISFECEREWMEKFGDHYLVIGKVLKEKVKKEKFPPLLHKSGDEFLEIK